jgi:hypothetical protein
MEGNKDIILGYLSREHTVRRLALEAMASAEVMFKVNADQKALSDGVIADLLDDLIDCEFVDPPVSMGD